MYCFRCNNAIDKHSNIYKAYDRDYCSKYCRNKHLLKYDLEIDNKLKYDYNYSKNNYINIHTWTININTKNSNEDKTNKDKTNQDKTNQDKTNQDKDKSNLIYKNETENHKICYINKYVDNTFYNFQKYLNDAYEFTMIYFE